MPARPRMVAGSLLLQAYLLLLLPLAHKAQALWPSPGCPRNRRALIPLRDLRLFIPPLLSSRFLINPQVTTPMTLCPEAFADSTMQWNHCSHFVISPYFLYSR